MPLLTSCKVHISRNIRTAVLTYGPNDIRSVQKTKVRIFSVWNEQLTFKIKLYCTATMKLSENFQKTNEISLEAQFCDNQTKNITNFRKCSVSFW